MSENQRFYLSVESIEGKLFHRWKERGSDETHMDVITDYPLVLYTKADFGGDAVGIRGEKLNAHHFSNVSEFGNFLYRNRDTGIDIYGMDKAEYQFIKNEYAGEFIPDMGAYRILYFDIETEIGDSFPKPENPVYPINAITAVTSIGDNLTWSYYDATPDNGVLHHCTDEIEVLKGFVEFVESYQPDIVCTFNGLYFDMPYIVSRIRKVIGGDYVYRLSPYYSYVKPKTRELLIREGKPNTFGDRPTVVKGLIHMDYLELYKKYAREEPDNFKLNTIAMLELGVGKTDYSPYRDLEDLYQNDKKLFLEYNIQDVLLLRDLEAKVNMIKLAIVISALTKCNLEDIYQVTTVWDTYLYGAVSDRGNVIPPRPRADGEKDYVGGYVREPIAGKHKWTCSFDLTSMYPMLMSMFNLSFDSLTMDAVEDVRERERQKEDIILLKETERTVMAKNLGYICAANGSMYRKDGQRGIIAETIDDFFVRRKNYQRDMKKYKSKAEKLKSEIEKRGLKV